MNKEPDFSVTNFTVYEVHVCIIIYNTLLSCSLCLRDNNQEIRFSLKPKQNWQDVYHTLYYVEWPLSLSYKFVLQLSSDLNRKINKGLTYNVSQNYLYTRNLKNYPSTIQWISKISLLSKKSQMYPPIIQIISKISSNYPNNIEGILQLPVSNESQGYPLTIQRMSKWSSNYPQIFRYPLTTEHFSDIH